VNRTLPRGDFRHRKSDPGGASRSGGAVSGCVRLVCGTAVDRKETAADELHVIKHGGFERGRTPPALLETVAPLETLCASSVRMEDRVGQCS